MHDPANILAMTSWQFTEQAAARGLARSHALELYRTAFREGRFNDLDWVRLEAASIANIVREFDTVKFTQELHGSLETESVVLPHSGSSGRARNTLCVSSQIGCAMGCTFCETAQMGLMKNLSAEQIVGQWFAARFMLNITIDNIVFMGMGEPTDNLDQVIHAIRILADRNGPAIAPARIAVSTVGRAAGIARLADFAREAGFHKLRLAVSINAPNDRIRSAIMPINRAEPMAALMQAMLTWPAHGQRILIEYVLIPGVNDSVEHAAELCEYLSPLHCTVNVIPYNPRRNSPWPAPAEESVASFTKAIAANGQFVKRRQTLGRSVMAACGQLGNPTIRRRRAIQLTTPV